MPMSWAGTSLRKNDMRRVLAGALTTLFGSGAGNNTGLDPLNTLSSTLTEAFEFRSAQTFSDTAGTVLANVGDSIALVTARGGRSEKLTTYAGNRPTLGSDAVSGNPTAILKSSSAATSAQYFLRSYKGDVGTVLAVFAFDKSGPPSRGAWQTLCSMAGANSASSYELVYKNLTGYSANDRLAFTRLRADGTSTEVAMSALVGSTDVVLVETDGSAYGMNRSGVQATVPQAVVAAAASTPAALVSGNLATLGARGISTGSVDRWSFGNLLGFYTWSGKLSAAEKQGVLQYAVNLAKQKSTASKYIGVLFQGNGTGEGAANQGPVMMVTDDLVNFQNRPMIGMKGASGASTAFISRDFGLAYDNGALVAMSAGDNSGNIPVYACTDGVNFPYIMSIPAINTTDLTGAYNPLAPSLVKNKDGSLYKDPATGLPWLFFCATPTGQASSVSYIYYMKATASDWATNPASWAPPVKIGGNPGGTHVIDPQVTLVDGTFHLIYSYYGTGSGTNSHATATALDGTWTQVGANNAFSDDGQGYEGAQAIFADTNNVTMLIDKDGRGYSYQKSTTGIGGTFTSPVAVTSPYVMEQGEFIPMPAGFPSPALQSQV